MEDIGMKRLASLMLAAALLLTCIPALSLTANAQSGTCGDNLTWSVNMSTGELVISGTGPMYHYDRGPWYDFRTYVKSVRVCSGVTTIGNQAFYNMAQLKTVTIADTVTDIYGCAFAYTHIEEISLPSGMTQIRDYAFAYSNLKTVTIPEGITSIGDMAFYFCELTSVSIPDSVTEIGMSAFPDTVVYNKYMGMNYLGNSKNRYHALISVDDTTITEYSMLDMTKVIASGAFMRASSLGTVKVGNNITRIPERAFDGCSKLKEVKLPAGLKTIGENAFAFCPSLEQIELNDGLEVIEISAFLACSALKSVVLPESLITIGAGFARCDALTFNVYSGGQYLPSKNNPYFALVGTQTETIKTCTIHDGTELIADYAFSLCEDLTKVSIPQSVRTIGTGAFNRCENLRNVSYDGYQEQWDAISIGEKNEALLAAQLQVKPPELIGITIKTLPTKTTYVQGDALDPTGLVLLASYHDGTSAEITKGFTFTGFDSKKAGTVKVTVNYEGQQASFSVQVLTGGSCGETVQWSFVDGVLTIFGEGKMEDYMHSAPWYEDAYKIKKVVIEPGVTTVGAYSFYGAKNLTQVELPDTLERIEYYAFYGCHTLPEIRIPEGVTYIGRIAFESCWSLERATIPESLQYLGENAFAYCRSLKEVSVPAGLTQIEDYAFAECAGMTGIWVDEQNPVYSSDRQGALLNKDQTLLIRVPGAVRGAYYVPETVTRINSDAFSSCESLEIVTIPSTVATIDYYAFVFCDSLHTVNYNGTQEQREAIAIGSHNDDLVSAYWNMNGFVYADDLQTALRNAQTGITVIMTRDESVKNLVIRSGVILDLNGYCLTTDYFTCYGTIVDGAWGGKGLVKTNKQIHIMGQDSYLPIFDTKVSGYRFYWYDLMNLGFRAVDGNQNATKVGIRLLLKNPDGYRVLSQTTDECIDLLVNMNWNGLSGIFSYCFGDDTLRNYADLVFQDMEKKGNTTKAVTLTISGLEILGTGGFLQTQPIIETAIGITAIGNEESVDVGTTNGIGFI